MNLHMFEEYKSSEKVVLSINDVIKVPKVELQTKVFVFAQNYNSLFENKYFKVKVNILDGESENEIMVTLIDTTQEVLRQNEQAHNELMIMINATVSHELRNPLNSIVAINMQKEMIYKHIQDVIGNQKLSQKEIEAQTKELFAQLREGLYVQQSSTKLSQFLVQDLLDYS